MLILLFIVSELEDIFVSTELQFNLLPKFEEDLVLNIFKFKFNDNDSWEFIYNYLPLLNFSISMF